MNTNTKRESKGFTLLEILLVIAAIGILASIVLVAINPNRQIAQVRDAQRRSDINTIYKALEQYLIDNGSYPTSVNSNFKEICNTGNRTTIDTLNPTTLCDNKVDLRGLVPTYIAGIPIAPSGGQYRLAINGNNRIEIYTVGGSNQIIALNFNDIDAATYIAAVETADGQSLEENVKIAINDFIIGLKTDGLWTPIKASAILGGARTLSGALVPLKGPAPTNYNFVSDDYNRKTGLRGNGSTKYLDSKRKNSDDPQNNQHLSIYVTTNATGNHRLIGAGAGGAGRSTVGQTSGGLGTFRSQTNSLFTSNLGIITGEQLIGFSRSTPGEFSVRLNKNNQTISAPSQTPTTDAIEVFRADIDPTNARLAFYSIGESLDLSLLEARVTALTSDLKVAITATQLVFTNSMNDLFAGGSRDLRVEARDAGGNLVTDYTEIIEFSQIMGDGTVMGLGEVVSVGGVATITVTGETAGSITIGATDGELTADPTIFTIATGTIFDPDAATYIAAVETADGQSLEENVKIAINDFIIGLKTDGLWTPIKASAILGGARTLSGALVPLKGPAPTNYNFVSDDYNRKTGLRGNGSTKYLDSKRKNSDDPQNNQHLSIYVTTNATGNHRLIGAGAGGAGRSTVGQTSGGLGTFRSQTNSLFTSNLGIITGEQLIGFSRSTPGEFSVRLNKNNQTISAPSQTPTTDAIEVFRADIDPTNARLAFYSIGESLDLSLLEARVTALITNYSNFIP
jgi:prepilin-type N-terminal cleavage/methylation domain-containing protein